MVHPPVSRDSASNLHRCQPQLATSTSIINLRHASTADRRPRRKKQPLILLATLQTYLTHILPHSGPILGHISVVMDYMQAQMADHAAKAGTTR